MREIAGLTLLYVIPGVIAATFWLWPIRRLINLWVGRDVMLGFIPKARHVNHTEKLLRVFRPKPPKPNMIEQLKSAYIDMLMRLVRQEQDTTRRRDMLDRIERTFAAMKNQPRKGRP